MWLGGRALVWLVWSLVPSITKTAVVVGMATLTAGYHLPGPYFSNSHSLSQKKKKKCKTRKIHRKPTWRIVIPPHLSLWTLWSRNIFFFPSKGENTIHSCFKNKRRLKKIYLFLNYVQSDSGWIETYLILGVFFCIVKLSSYTSFPFWVWFWSLAIH